MVNLLVIVSKYACV